MLRLIVFPGQILKSHSSVIIKLASRCLVKFFLVLYILTFSYCIGQARDHTILFRAPFTASDLMWNARKTSRVSGSQYSVSLRYPSNNAAARERGPQTLGRLHALRRALLRTNIRTIRHIRCTVSFLWRSTSISLKTTHNTNHGVIGIGQNIHGQVSNSSIIITGPASS